MKNIIVSACLLGVPCRYDGKSKENKKLMELGNQFNFLPVCPEEYGGLPTPRVPAEIRNGKVINKNGFNVTANYIKGAKEVLKICKLYNCDTAILKSKSPACGKGKIYDGTFSGTLIDGNGITTDLLIKNGIKVYTEDEFINEFKSII